jgi:hypothetical protein
MANHISTTIPDSSRILLLPEADDSYINSQFDTYSWGYFSLDFLPRNILNREIVTSDSLDVFSVHLLYESLYSGDINRFIALARNMRITHILWRGDLRWLNKSKQEKTFPIVEKALQNVSTISLEYANGPWKLYGIYYDNNIPEIAVFSDNVEVSVAPFPHDAWLIPIGSSVADTGLIRIEKKSIQHPMIKNADSIAFEAECLFCKENEYQGFVGSVVLSSPKFLPGSFWYKTVEKKKTAIFQETQDTPSKRIDADLSFGLVHISEIIQAIKEKKDSMVFQLSASSFIQVISDVRKQFKSLDGREKTHYANRLQAYGEAFQREINAIPMINQRVKLQSEIFQLFDVVKPFVWMTTDDAYRFQIDLDEEGAYMLMIPEIRVEKLFVDGNEVTIGIPAYFSKGYHKIEISKKITTNVVEEIVPVLYFQKKESSVQTVTPRVTYKKVNPTFYRVHIMDANNQFFLQLDQRYDSRWKIFMIKSSNKSVIETLFGKPIAEEYHVEMNGYANGWYMNQKGSYDMIIFYWPQVYFYIGIVVSVITGICCIIYFFNKKKFIYDK